MGLRIRTNVESLNAQRNLFINSSNLNSNMEKLSSGSRINKSSDDAAGLAVSETLRAKIGGLVQAKRNTNDGISVIQTAEGALNETTNILIRMRELAVQSASDTIGVKERDYLNKEYRALTDEIDRISATTEFNGKKLLGPQKEETEISLQVGYNDSPNDSLKIKMGNIPEGINVETLGLTESMISGPERDKIASQLDVLDNALTKIANTRASLGATQSRLNSVINTNMIATENMRNTMSQIKDVDFAEETAKLAQNKILTQSGVSVLSQANQKPEVALALLR